MDSQPIFVTKPDLPSLEALQPYLERIWASSILTNGGPIHQELEERLHGELDIDAISLFTNGTIALVTALQALRISGEVITTPYSFVATSHALLWNRLIPVFVDIDPCTGNIDPGKIERAITPQTTAILAVHVYGTPCEVVKIQEIADMYCLKVIYDASHAFGVSDNGGSILRHGDLSTLSFHATKVFNTFEGGAIASPNPLLKTRIDRLKNFGFIDETTVLDLGINGKMNEFQASIGLLQLNLYRKNILNRQLIAQIYRRELSSIPGIDFLPEPEEINHNYSYMPILVSNNCRVSRDELYFALKEKMIFARRYFYPLISEFSAYKSYSSSDISKCPVAFALSRSVLCLPINGSMTAFEQRRVIDAIVEICFG